MKAKKKISIELKKDKLAKLTNLNTSEIKGGRKLEPICSNAGGQISTDNPYANPCHR